jgi:phage-related holin
MIIIVVVCIIADFVLLLACQNLPYDVINFRWPMVISPLVTMWYILTEIGSIIENAVEMGAKVPAWLPKILNATLHTIDAAGEGAFDIQDEKDTSGLIEED